LWSKDGQQLAPPAGDEKPYRMETDGSHVTLRFGRVAPSDAGWYQCTAMNSAGTATSRAKLTVQTSGIRKLLVLVLVANNNNNNNNSNNNSNNNMQIYRAPYTPTKGFGGADDELRSSLRFNCPIPCRFGSWMNSAGTTAFRAKLTMQTSIICKLSQLTSYTHNCVVSVHLVKMYQYTCCGTPHAMNSAGTTAFRAKLTMQTSVICKLSQLTSYTPNCVVECTLCKEVHLLQYTSSHKCWGVPHVSHSPLFTYLPLPSVVAATYFPVPEGRKAELP